MITIHHGCNNLILTNYPSLSLAEGLPWKRPKCCYSTVTNDGSLLGTDHLRTLISSGHKGRRREIIDFFSLSSPPPPRLPFLSSFSALSERDLGIILCFFVFFLLYDSFKTMIHSRQGKKTFSTMLKLPDTLVY